MIVGFENLSETELQQLKDAVALISIYVGEADGNLDEEETLWAKKIAHIRGYKMHKLLLPYYQEVDEDFDQRFEYFLESLPKEVDARSQFITQKLEGLNPILAKLDNKVGALLYTSFISLARHIAEASGGLFRFFSVTASEEKAMGLSMITPINLIDEEEE